MKKMKGGLENLSLENLKREELEGLVDVSEIVAREKLQDPTLSPEARATYERSVSKIDAFNKSGMRQGERKVQLPSYQGQDDTVLWGGIIQDAGNLYKEYASQGGEIPKSQVEALRARVKKLEHPEAFRSNVGLSVWAHEIDKYGGMATYETLFGDNFTDRLEQAKAISDFGGYKLPPFRERRQTRLSYSQALLEAHRAFVKKAKSIRGAEMTETEREAFEAAQEADREATRFLLKTRDVKIYMAMKEESLGKELKNETELRETMVVLADARQPKTEEERQTQIDTLVKEKNRLWEEARQADMIGGAAKTLRTIIQIANHIEELRVAPLRGATKERVFAPQEEIDLKVAEFMDRIDTMMTAEFATGVEELKRYTPGKDTASIVGVLMSEAKGEREEAEALPQEQSLKRLYGEKRALILEEMASAIERGDKKIDLDPERVRERYLAYKNYIEGGEAVPEDKREEIESVKRRFAMVEIDERVWKIKKKLREERFAQRGRTNERARATGVAEGN